MNFKIKILKLSIDDKNKIDCSDFTPAIRGTTGESIDNTKNPNLTSSEFY